MASDTLKPPASESTTNASPSKVAKPYGDVLISLENCLLSEDRLQVTPSSSDGLDAETEMDLRILGCELIQTAGILLRLPQVAMATGQVLFQRFYYSKSFVRQSMEITAMGCVCLASKVEEAPRRIRDIVSVFNHVKQVRASKPLEPVLLDQNYINLKNQVIKAERRVLKELGFCVHVKHPHKIIVVYLQMLGFEKNKKLMQLCWNYMNDSLRTDVFVRYSPETIACACIYLSSRKLNIALPKDPAWYELFGCTEHQLKDICIRILKLYTRPKPNAEELEQIVAKLQNAYQESRLKQRQVAEEESNSHKQQLPHSPATAAIQAAAAAESKAVTVVSAASSPAPVKEGKSHATTKRSRTRSRSRSRSRSHSEKQDRRKSRHHRKKRSRTRSRSHEKRRDRDRDRRKRDSRERDRDHKHRKDRERSRERERDRRSRKDRSVSRERRR